MPRMNTPARARRCRRNAVPRASCCKSTSVPATPCGRRRERARIRPCSACLPPHVLAYPREAVVAEKFEAMVVLGDRNSRIKDYFDLHRLASDFAFDRATLTESVRRTFVRRSTPIPDDDPIGLTKAYWQNSSRPAQVRAFARRAGLDVSVEPDEAFVRLLGAFLRPILDDLREGSRREGSWAPGGPWR